MVESKLLIVTLSDENHRHFHFFHVTTDFYGPKSSNFYVLFFLKTSNVKLRRKEIVCIYKLNSNRRNESKH